MVEAVPKLVEKEEHSEALMREAPHNVEAEQALLGAILLNNEALHHIVDGLLPEQFYQPLHQKIYRAIAQHHEKGLIANAVTLKHHFTKDDSNIGEYLGQLSVSAVSIINVTEYSQIILDLAKKRELISIGTEVVNEAYNAEDERTASEHIEQAEQQLYHLASEGIANKSFAAISQSVQEAIETAELAYKREGETSGIPGGLKGLDKLLGGFQNSDLIILAGRPSMGKTALALTIAHNIAKHMKYQHDKSGSTAKIPSVGFFSLEMSSEQLAGRLLSSDSGVNSSDIRRGNIDANQFSELIDSSKNIAQLPLFIDDTPALTIASTRARARRLKRMHNLSMLFVDYLQLMRGSTKSGDNRVQEVSEITMGLKSIAKELNIPVVALSQLSRQVENREDKRPQLADLRESGSIEQDADIVMFVYREEYYKMRTQPNPEDAEKFAAWQEDMDKVHGLAEVIVSKNRHGGIENVTCAFQADLARFGDLETDGY